MSTALLYLVVGLATLALCRRLVQPLSKRAAVILLLLPLAFTGKALLTGRIYAPIDLPLQSEPLKSVAGDIKPHNGMLSDVYSHNIPWKAAVRAAYANGEWPLWNPYVLGGDILAASAQPAPYEPYFLTSLALPLANSLTYLAAINLLLAGLVMFVFLRDLQCSEEASLLGAAAWMFSSFNVFWLEWAIGTSTLWFPLVVTGIRRCIRERSLAAMGLLTFAFVMMLLAGHPETALHIVFLGIIWSAAELIAIRARHLARIALLGSGAGLLALMLTAVFVIPIVEALPQTYEHYVRARTPMQQSVPTEVALERFVFQLLPFRYGDPASAYPGEPPAGFPENAYAGSVLLPLAAIGLSLSRNRTKWAALALAIAGIILGIGAWPFADLLAKLPLFDIAVNTRLIFAASFGVIALAALGVDVALTERRFALLAAVSMIALLVLAALCAADWSAMHATGLPQAFIWRRVLALLVPLAVVAAACAWGRRPTIVAFAMLALLVAQRTIESAHFYPTLPATLFYPRVPILDRIPRGEEPFRIVGKGMMFYPNMSSVYGLEDVRGYTAMTFLRLRTTYPIWCVPQPIWWNRVDDLTSPFLSMMNVRYALAREGEPLPAGWKRIAADRGTELLENERVLPRAFAPRVVRINRPFQVIGAELSSQEDFREVAWIDAEEAPTMDVGNGEATVTVRKRGLRALALHTSAKAPAWIVVTQPAWKGWRVLIDGKSAKVRHANFAFLAFYAPAGEHDVRVEYLPQGFVAGRMISGVTLLGVIGFAIGRRRLATRGTDPRSDRS